MKVPDKFPPGCVFEESFGGDEYVGFPDGRWFRLLDSGDLKLMAMRPSTGLSSNEARFRKSAAWNAENAAA